LDEDSVKIEIIRVTYVFTIMSTNIYILKLQGCKYYIGKSENPMKRYHEHLSGKGATWTKKYKPISIEKIIEKVSHFDEDTYTIVYMAKYGIENVRGGTYVSIQLILPESLSPTLTIPNPVFYMKKWIRILLT